MTGELAVSLSTEALDFGPAEERATFGLLAVTANDHLLTFGEDIAQKELRHGPHVSGYPVAEWLAWNWWRLRWEISRPSDETAILRWDFAHRMSTIGEGYVWPNITISSDGVQSFLVSQSSRDPGTALFRYFGAPGRERVPATHLEAAIDGFLEDILDRLEGAKVHESNLRRLWNDLKTERADPELARFRRLEAQLGHEPDEADENEVRLHLADATELGEDASGEIAADAVLAGGGPQSMFRAGDLARMATQNGFDCDPKDAIVLGDRTSIPQPGQVEAWSLGEQCAKGIRQQENLDGLPMDDRTLTDFAGTVSKAVAPATGPVDTIPISFALDGKNGPAPTRIALRSRWSTGRRFDLARLIGDRMLWTWFRGSSEPLFPATRAFSYRQKMQRAFAAELLSPFMFVDDMMNGDYSEEKQNEVAEHFKVSPMTFQTQLVNHRRLDRDDAPDIVHRDPASWAQATHLGRCVYSGQRRGWPGRV